MNTNPDDFNNAENQNPDLQGNYAENNNEADNGEMFNANVSEPSESTEPAAQASNKTEQTYYNNNFSEQYNRIPYGGYAYQQNMQYPNGNQNNSYSDIPTPNNNDKKSKKRGASKGFVISAIAIGLLLSVAINTALTMLCGDMLDGKLGGRSGENTSSGEKIVVQYTKKDTPVVTNKGSVAYVASVSADTVVEITTETVSTSMFYGQYITSGAGSGVIISSNDSGSYILTCAHVISGSSRITVTTRSGEKYEATIKGYDDTTDVGVIHVDVSGLPVATIGEFSDVVVGEGVVVIGNPLGSLGGSVTSGYVSALDRDIMIDGQSYHLLQSDAAINPGNSGGGMFNMDGDLIGIVSAKSSGTNVEGLGYAIPVNNAMTIATQIIENGYVGGRAKLGFTLCDITDQTQAYNFWSKYHINVYDYGVYITDSVSANFMLGDRIIAIDSITVSSISEVKSLLLDYSVGDKVTITISRQSNNGRYQVLNIEHTLMEDTSNRSK